jgi:PiT family inorganic phosphate transporter
MAFSHGAQDAQKTMGVITLALVTTGHLSSFEVPLWVIIAAAGAISLGTYAGGWRIMRTLGMRVTKLQTHQGFAAETAAASTIELASRLGIPLSTTHTISTAIMGVGATRGLSAVRWGVTRDLVTAWVLTFPICAGISYACVKVIRLVS